MGLGGMDVLIRMSLMRIESFFQREMSMACNRAMRMLSWLDSSCFESSHRGFFLLNHPGIQIYRVSRNEQDLPESMAERGRVDSIRYMYACKYN